MNYQYTININQHAVIENGFDLDIVDMAILDFVEKFANTTQCVKMQTDKGVFFWISYNLVREALPILRIKSNQGIANHIEKLIAANLLVRYDNNVAQHKSFYGFGQNYDMINFVENPQENLGLTPKNICSLPPKNFGAIINNNNHNNNYHNNKEADETKISSFFPEMEQEEKNDDKEDKAVKRLFCNSAIYCLVTEDEAGHRDYSKFEAQFVGEEYANIDLAYYFHAVADWSDQKNMKRTNRGWLATIRNFIRGDMEKNKLHVKQQVKQPESVAYNEAMQFLNNDY